MPKTEPPNVNLKDLSKIPENEFKQHFRDWMEQDDVARSLQAKMRKDLISNFNKTFLGKKIISEEAISHRLTLSPLTLAINTLVAEFLYALNCHFTLSVFCSEVPYRNTLPNFEGARHFRFSEREIFEIFDALCSSWEQQTKDVICEEYAKENNVSMLFVLLRNLLNKEIESAQKTPQKNKTPKQTDSKAESQNNHFSYLNKYLIILSKKVTEMSQNLEILQKQKNTPQTQRKSVQTRKFKNLNRSLEKISDNLRQMSVTKRKNKRLSTVVTAVNNMSTQFEKCAMNFEQICRGSRSAGACDAVTEKSYSDWIREMRTTDNGKKFLEKIESTLRRTLQRESEKKERELEQRLLIQKEMLKTKYKQKFAEELAKYTSRDNTDDVQKVNESFERKLYEFEAKHKELHQRILEAEERIREAPVPNHSYTPIDSKATQTATDSTIKPTRSPVDSQNELQKMVKTMSEQERHVDYIVFDAKLRIQELEHESNQLDHSFRSYLQRQRSEKQKMRENATSIWQSYALGKSMLDKKCAAFRSTSRTKEKHPVISKATPSFPIINIDTSVSAENPLAAFENPFRVAQRKVLARSKTLPPPLTSTDDESSAEKYTRFKGQQQSGVFRLMEHDDNDDYKNRIKVAENLPPYFVPPKVTPVTQGQLSPELNIKDITLDGIEMSPTTARSSSPRSGDSNCSSSSLPGVFKLRRQLFTTTDNGDGGSPSSSNGQQMKSNCSKEAEKLLKQINNENSEVNYERKGATVNKGMPAMRRKDGETRTSEVHCKGSSRNDMDVPLTGVDENVSLQHFPIGIPSVGEGDSIPSSSLAQVKGC